VELSASTDKIYYTTDGTTPTESSNLYSDPILINRTTNLKAVAISEDGEVSEIASFQYTAAQKAKTPEASEESDSVLEPGTVVTLRTDTDNAQIYYSTDGTEPTLDNLDHMLTYTEDGITINRTVTIKAVAYREDLQLSAIGSFQYLVETIPAVEVRQQQEAQQAAAGLHDTDSSSLDREQSYDGTKYKSRVLTHEESQIVISSSWTAVPKDAVVQAKEQDCTDAAVKNIKTLFGEDYQIIQSYDISLSEGGTIIQPDGPVEIGIPIPEKYLDAAVTIIYIDSENKITKLDTRREDGMAYATVEHFSHYAMVGVEEESTGGWSFDYLLILEFLAALTAFGGVGYFARLKWKKFHESH
jgi:hypothetical protein